MKNTPPRNRAFCFVRNTIIGAVIAASPAAYAQSRNTLPELPSVELNLDVVKSLQNESRAEAGYDSPRDLQGKKLIWEKGPEKKFLPDDKLRDETPKPAPVKPKKAKKKPAAETNVPVHAAPIAAPKVAVPTPKPVEPKVVAPKPAPVAAPLPKVEAPKAAEVKLPEPKTLTTVTPQPVPAPLPVEGKSPLLEPIPAPQPLAVPPQVNAPLPAPMPLANAVKPAPVTLPEPIKMPEGIDPALKDIITKVPTPAPLPVVAPDKKPEAVKEPAKDEKKADVKTDAKPKAKADVKADAKVDTKKPLPAKEVAKEPALENPLTVPPLPMNEAPLPLPPGIPKPETLNTNPPAVKPEVKTETKTKMEVKTDKISPAVTLPEMKVTEPKVAAPVPLTPVPLPENPPVAALPEVTSPPVPSVTAQPVQPKAVAKKEDDGWFPNIKKSVKGMFGGEEAKMAPSPVITPASTAEKLPAVLPPPGETTNGLPPLPAFNAPAASSPAPMPAAQGNLPSLSPVIGNQPNATPGAPLGFLENPNEVKSASLAPALPPLSPPLSPPKDAPKEVQMASNEKTPSTAPVAVTGNAELVVSFAKDSNSIAAADKDKIAGIAQRLKSGGAKTARVVAYMGEGADSTPRRIALSRGLEIRAQMIQAGVDPLNVNVEVLDKKKRAGATANMADVFLN